MNNLTALPMIEVIIPAYNAAAYIEETLASACAQTLLPAFITVVDDSSTDDTATRVQRFAQERAPRGTTVQLLRNSGLRGPSAARNVALRRGTVPWVAFLDADDLMQPAQLATLADALSVDDQAVLSFVDTLLFNEDGVVEQSLFKLSGVSSLPAKLLANDVFTLGELTFNELAKTGIFGTSACLMRRSAVLQVGLFDESMMYCEDTDLFLRMSLLGSFAFTRQILSHKRIHGQNLTHPKNAVHFGRGTVYLLAKILGMFSENQSDIPALTPAQVNVVKARLSEAVQGYLYHASLGGVAQYRRAINLCKRAGYKSAATKPRHLARLAASYVVGIPGLDGLFRNAKK